MTEAAFFYGTLMATEIIADVLCGRSAPPAIKVKKLASLKMTLALLKGHRRYAVKHAEYPGILETENPNDQVEGILCEGLTLRDVEALDEYEGDEYERRQVNVIKKQEAAGQAENDGGMVPCQVYLWVADRQQLDDKDWDYDHWRKTHLPTTLV
ncbi:Butirosin biosynthesis, BtrG-like protein [Chlamydoabsidia padenii]|nr:Butirosin biosynthesis, BtrG-like protein [Chlamydoabsidia padenii]